MPSFRNRIPLLLPLLLCLLLCACGGAELSPAPAETASPAAESAAAAAAPSVSEPAPEPEAAPEPTPEPTPEPLLFPDGSLHDPEETELDLSRLTHEDAAAAAELLSRMPALKRVELGEDRIRAAEETGEEPAAEERLAWADIRLLQEAAPQADFDYRFRFYGKDFSLQDETMDLNHRSMDDEGEAVREILPCMKRCRYLDMDFCGVSDEAMARIRDENPGVEVVWRIWFGSHDYYSVRTDAVRILSSDERSHLRDDNTQSLKYCTKVKYLDLGHRPTLTDWSFLGYMPELEVVILSLGDWHDLSCLRNAPHIEFLEICCPKHPGNIDISFVGDLKELRHLDICCLGENVTGYEVLADMPYLERLWIGRYTDIPKDFLDALPEKLPDTLINTTTYSGCNDSWRYLYGGENDPLVPRYALLKQQFGYNDYSQTCSAFYNDPLYYPHG